MTRKQHISVQYKNILRAKLSTSERLLDEPFLGYNSQRELSTTRLPRVVEQKREDFCNRTAHNGKEATQLHTALQTDRTCTLMKIPIKDTYVHGEEGMHHIGQERGVVVKWSEHLQAYTQVV